MDPTQRFSQKADEYDRYRPSYPQEVILALKDRCPPVSGTTLADVGSGTGIFTELLLQGGYRVFAVEPNDEMRLAAERRLQSVPGFHSVAGTAEDTRLDTASVQMITVAQAFHWFRGEETRSEFRRILRAPGWVALVWNYRKAESAFQSAYEELLQRCLPEYKEVGHRKVDVAAVKGFLGPTDYQFLTFENSQHFDWPGLKGRTLSSSYTPLPGKPGHDLLMKELEKLFEEHAADGQITFEYETHLHLARLTNA
jgi:SAM-dependent methyltransferase